MIKFDKNVDSSEKSYPSLPFHDRISKSRRSGTSAISFTLSVVSLISHDIWYDITSHIFPNNTTKDEILLHLKKPIQRFN